MPTIPPRDLTQSERPPAVDAPVDEPRPRSDDRLARFTRIVLPAVVYAGLLAVLVQAAALPLYNTDTYFHLRFGSEFLHGWSLTHPGSVSTFATSPWLPTQWLPEVVMAKTEQWFGLAGVAWLSGAQMVLLLTSLYVVARRWADPLVAVLLTIAALVASSDGLSMRPQVLSYVLVVVTAGAWLRTRDDGRIRWWLVPLTWVWAMVHGMWPIGIGLGVVAVAGMAADRALPRRDLGRAALVPLLSAVVAALTPVGPGLYGAVLGVGSRSRFFSEWGSPSFHSPSCISLALMLALAVVLMARHGRVRWLDVLLLLVAGACAVWSWRTVPVAAMVMVPLAAVQVSLTPRARLRPSPVLGRRELCLLAAGAALALGALALAVPHTSDAPPPQPSWEDPALSALPAGTKVVDEWDWGGYLMWRYPQLDLLMHGYGDTFTIAELQRNTDIQALSPGWDTELRATGCTIAVLRSTSRLAYALEHQEHWQVLHRSSTTVELLAPAGWASGTG